MNVLTATRQRRAPDWTALWALDGQVSDHDRRPLTQLPRGGLVQDDVRQAVAGRGGHQVAHGPPQGHAQVARRRPQDGHSELVRHAGHIVAVDLRDREAQSVFPLGTHV